MSDDKLRDAVDVIGVLHARIVEERREMRNLLVAMALEGGGAVTVPDVILATAQEYTMHVGRAENGIVVQARKT